MPNGKTHTKATVFVTVVVVAFTFAFPDASVEAKVASVGGALSGLILTPDLDVDDGCYAHYIVREYMGKIAYFFWKAYWRPYGRVIPHRDWKSHAPVIGTAFRALYIAPVVVGLFYLLKIRFDPVVALAWFGALAINDTIHFLLDVFIKE